MLSEEFSLAKSIGIAGRDEFAGDSIDDWGLVISDIVGQLREQTLLYCFRIKA
jgi:hypothetical protein